ncbi:Conserved_hypothetical protein [Hexamita inflata]|uniref:Transmembrane protein n=1 Tax=Hexamita inflata TaxID=28002 RepID=A0AA86NCA5_9EUKA|nr:Conserved hypothetical protein [Hexamita inflata]
MCTDKCSSALPYNDSKICSNKCTSGAYQTVNNNFVCVNACVLYLYNQTSNQKQCITNCNQSAPYYETGACVQRCTSGMYTIATGAQPLMCQTAACPYYLLNISNGNSKQCITSCPSNTPYYENNTCVSSCKSSKFSVIPDIKLAVCEDAPCTFYIVNASNGAKKCLSSCPSDSPFSDAGLCTSRCSSGSYSNLQGVLTCQASCNQLYIFNASNSNSKLCVSVCSSNQIQKGYECISNQGCPTDQPYNDSKICSNKCASGAYEIVNGNLVCVPYCVLYLFNQTSNQQQCITKCPDAAPYYNVGSCVKQCVNNDFTLINNVQSCQDTCQYWIVNVSRDNAVQCFPKCPAQAPFSRNGYCNAWCNYYTNDSGILNCYDKCPSLYIISTQFYNSKQCVNACTSNQTQQGKECVTNIVCSASSVQIGKICADKCPTDQPYNDSKICSNKCASGAYEIVNGNLVCVPYCVLYLFNQTSNQQQCITKCPDAAPYYNVGSCVKQCVNNDFTLINNVQSCQDTCQYWIVNVSRDNAVQCFPKCPAQAPFSRNGYCNAWCANYANISGQLTCVKSCPVFFMVNKEYPNANMCIDSCNSSQILKEKECRPKCNGNCASPVVKSTIIVSLVVIFIFITIILTFVYCRKNHKNAIKKVKTLKKANKKHLLEPAAVYTV